MRKAFKGKDHPSVFFSFFFLFLSSFFYLWLIDDENFPRSSPRELDVPNHTSDEFRFDPLPFPLKKIWTSPFLSPSPTPWRQSRGALSVSEITFFLLVAARSRRRPGRKEWRRGGEDRRSSFLFALLWRPNNAARSYSSKRDFPRSEGGHGCVNPVPTKFRGRNIHIYVENIATPIFSSRRGWKISFSRRMKTRDSTGRRKKIAWKAR